MNFTRVGVRLPRNSWPHFTVSNSRLPQLGGTGPLIYIPQEQGGLIIPIGTGFPFCRLLRLAGLRLKYSTTPPHGNWFRLSCNPRYIASGRPQQKTHFPNIIEVFTSPLHRNGSSSIVACVFVAAWSRCLAMAVCSGSTIPAFRIHVTYIWKGSWLYMFVIWQCYALLKL
jgi:hypothetical protein